MGIPYLRSQAPWAQIEPVQPAGHKNAEPTRASPGQLPGHRDALPTGARPLQLPGHGNALAVMHHRGSVGSARRDNAPDCGGSEVRHAPAEHTAL
jgi:hypothetical protein